MWRAAPRLEVEHHVRERAGPGRRLARKLRLDAGAGEGRGEADRQEQILGQDLVVFQEEVVGQMVLGHAVDQVEAARRGDEAGRLAELQRALQLVRADIGVAQRDRDLVTLSSSQLNVMVEKASGSSGVTT